MTHLLLHLAAALLLRLFSPAGATSAATDVAALAALKAAIIPSTIPQFSCLASWNISAGWEPCRTFQCGISCSADGRVTAVSLDPAGYSARIPASISNLSHLQILDLSNNFFRSPIPTSLTYLSNLQSLVLTSNSFTGPIPFHLLSNLTSLQTLELSRNSFSGTIPVSLSSLSALAVLDLSYNHLTGSIPSSLPPNLVTLALRGNSLAGSLTRSAFEPLTGLEVADLAENRLGGKLEGWLLRLPKIQQVNLANNSLDKWEVWPAGSGLSGGGEDLVAVDVGYNRIGGPLPAELAGYASLVALRVSNNRLRGGIPWEYHGGKKGAAFRRLFLDGNFLIGRVPAEFIGGEMDGSFGDNCLEGCPPASVLCSPGQKPRWLCKTAYSGGNGGRRR